MAKTLKRVHVPAQMGDYASPEMEPYVFIWHYLDCLRTEFPDPFIDLYERIHDETVTEESPEEQGPWFEDWMDRWGLRAEWTPRWMADICGGWKDFVNETGTPEAAWKPAATEEEEAVFEQLKEMRHRHMRETYGEWHERLPAPVQLPSYVRGPAKVAPFSIKIRGWDPEEETWADAQERLEGACRDAVRSARQAGLKLVEDKGLEQSLVKRELREHCRWLAMCRIGPDGRGMSKNSIADKAAVSHKTVSDAIGGLTKILGLGPKGRVGG